MSIIVPIVVFAIICVQILFLYSICIVCTNLKMFLNLSHLGVLIKMKRPVLCVV